jgi:hypothetical protein
MSMQDPDSPAGPEDDRLDEQPEVAADDRAIGRALRYSLWVLLAGALIAVAVWWFGQDKAVVSTLDEAPLQAPQATPQPQRSPPRVRFADVGREWGIAFRHHNGAQGERLLPETMGGGVAIFDFDNDGLQDLLFVNGSDWPWQEPTRPAPTAALYRNLGQGRFADVTEGSGLDLPLYGMGVAIADVDGDGLRDVYLTAVGANRLLRNLGNGRFEDITAAAGVAGDPQAWSSGALYFDYDRDGKVDLFVLDYVQWSREIDAEIDYRLTGIGRAYGPPTNYAGTHSKLYRNLGGGRFEDVSASAGIRIDNPATGLPMGKGLAATALDIDADGWLDIMVANDTVQNFLFRNLGNGSFEEVGAISGLAYDNSGSATGAMGVDAAWYANNDDQAVAVGNFANEMTSFYVAQSGSGLYTDESIVSGVGPDSRQALSFGLFFLDYDLDGRLDLFQTNGHIEDEINAVQPSQHYEQASQLFWNCGDDCSRPLQPVAAETLGDLALPVVGRGAAYGDLDGDGDLDLVITQIGRPALVLRNDQDSGHQWLRVALEGPPGNRDAIGARVSLRVGGTTQRRLQMPGRSYLSSVEPILTFGLGEATSVDELRVDWPEGGQTVLKGVAGGQVLTVSVREAE